MSLFDSIGQLLARNSQSNKANSRRRKRTLHGKRGLRFESLEERSMLAATDLAGGNQPHENVQSYVALNYIIATQGIFPSRNLGAEQIIGAVEMFAGNFAPVGYAMCDGSLLPIAENDVLFAIIGTTYGGDGQTTFAVPDLRGRVPVGAGQGAGLSNYTLGQVSGVETVTLSSSNLANHTHTVTGSASPTDATGGGQPFENRQPTLALTPVIALQGIFPSRDLSGNDMLGSVHWFAGDFAPRGYAIAAGQLLPINQNTALFSLLGTTYGGNGITTFALPDLRGRMAIGIGGGSSVQLGQLGGTETVTPTGANLPSHSHTITGSANPTGATGGSQPFDNRQPFLGLNYQISLQGIFPSRPLTAGDTGTVEPIGQGFNSGDVTLDEATARPLIDSLTQEAIRRWQAVGISDVQVATLQAASVVIGDLPYGSLATAGESVITLDRDASNRGWYLDATPGDNLEFDSIDPRSGELVATELAAAYHYDLLTALMHEQGHLLGLNHASLPGRIMYGGLGVGERTLPAAADLITDGSTPEGEQFLQIDPILASVGMFAGNFATRGWALTNGQLLPISQNTALFSLLGTTYGGDGRTNFALPDTQGRAILGNGQGPGLSRYDLGQTGGQDSVTLTVAQIPGHTHTLPAVVAAPTVTSPAAPTTVNAATFTITGTAAADSLVRVYTDANNNGVIDGGDVVVAQQQLAGGATAFSIPTPLTQDATNNFVVTANDAASNESAPADVPTITEDSTAPALPVVTSPATPTTVNAATFAITGTAAANSLVKVYTDINNNGAIDGGDTVVAQQQLSGGATSFSISTPLTQDAANNFVVTATDAASNESAPADVPTITEDSTAPALPVITSPAAPTTFNAATFAITGTAEANSRVQVYTDANNNGVIDGGDVVVAQQQLSGGATAFSISTPLTQDAANNFVVTATDAGSNESAPADVPTITEDSTAPALPVITSPGAPITVVSATTVTIAGTAEANALVKVYTDVNNNGVIDGADAVVAQQQLAGGATAFSISTPLTQDATNNFVVTATDAGSNQSAPTDVPTVTNRPSTAFTITDVTLSEGNAGTKTFTFMVTAAPANNASTSAVSWATADGTATAAGGDYVSDSGTLTFAPGVTNQTISITVIGDFTFEADETFFINLSNPTDATIADAQGLGTITNDDTAPTVTSPTATNIAVTTATLGGNVTSNGSVAITERGIVYAIALLNGNPQIGGTAVVQATTTGTTGIFTIDVSALPAGAQISYAAYAKNAVGTSYSSVSTFTTYPNVGQLPGATVQVIGNNLIITDNASNNQIRVVGTANTNEFTVSGLAGTLINGVANTNLTVQGVSNIIVNMSSGADSVTFDSTNVAGNVTIGGGSGTKNIRLGGTGVAQGAPGSVFVGGNLMINGGAGNGNIFVNTTTVVGAMSIVGGTSSGNNKINTEYTSTRGNFSITGGAGYDLVQQTQISVGAQWTINVGAGNDLISIAQCTAFGVATFNSGTGTDNISIAGSQLHAGVRMDGSSGGGSKTLNLYSTLYTGMATLIGGAMNDTLIFDNNTSFINTLASATLNSGGGRDTVLVQYSVLDALFADLGDDSDTLTIRGSRIKGFTSLNGGGGSNVFGNVGNLFEGGISRSGI